MVTPGSYPAWKADTVKVLQRLRCYGVLTLSRCPLLTRRTFRLSSCRV